MTNKKKASKVTHLNYFSNHAFQEKVLKLCRLLNEQQYEPCEQTQDCMQGEAYGLAREILEELEE